MMKQPVVVTVTGRTLRKNKNIDYVGELHLELLIRLRLLPVMVPVVDGTEAYVRQYMDGMAGLLLVEGDDVDPERYRARKADTQYAGPTHPLKDEIESRLARFALANDVPILGICRGCQLINVVSGGTLYGDVQKQTRSHLKHVDPDPDRYDAYRHQVTIVPATPLEAWYRQKTICVNSYHHQGMRQLSPRFKPMAHADDGLVEAYYDPKAAFVVGLQFHPERMLNEYEGNWRVWKAFGDAVHKRHSARRRMPLTTPSPKR
jgi:gamma-glutamyl-gamma-aminobutyrate hydrolase PuuD